MDHHDGSYTIRQMAAEYDSQLVMDTSWETRGNETVKVYEGIEKYRYRKFTVYEKFEADYITLRGNLIAKITAGNAVNGSLKISAFGKFFLIGHITIDNGWSSWTDFPI